MIPSGADLVLGRIVDNQAITVLGNNNTVVRTITVPVNRRWWFCQGFVYNADNVARAITVFVYNAATSQIGILLPSTSLAAAGMLSYIDTVAGISNPAPALLPLKAGDYISITFTAGGVSAGGNGSSSCVVIEVAV